MHCEGICGLKQELGYPFNNRIPNVPWLIGLDDNDYYYIDHLYLL